MKRPFNLPATPEQSAVRNNSHSYVNLLEAATETAVEVISQSTPASSLSGLDVVEQKQEMFIFNGAQSFSVGTLLHLTVFLLLLYTTISSYHRDFQSTKLLFIKERSQGDRGNVKNNKNRLGSAMIESITEVLSPILPFAGGVDLRRDGNLRRWFGLILNKKSIDSSHANDNDSQLPHASKKVALFPRGGSTHVNTRVTMSQADNIKDSIVPSLSNNDPFISRDDISQMTLNDLTLLFQYAIESGRDGFDFKKFVSKGHENKPMSQQAVDSMKAIDQATSKSRSQAFSPARTGQIQIDLGLDNTHEGPLSSKGVFGDVDALQFCAAMRLFGEWRVLRQVPPGYKGYAVGMSLGHKDIVQNVAKIENAVHLWIRNQAGVKSILKVSAENQNKSTTATMETELRSPTLRQLLQSEISMDIHPTRKLPYLKDGSAAMGLLWVRRQLHYQTATFRNILDVPKVFPSVIVAVSHAYSEVYGSLHGWAVQKIFNYSFQAAPDAVTVFRHMNPIELERVTKLATHESFNDGTAMEDGANMQKTVNTVSSFQQDESHFSKKNQSCNEKRDSDVFNDADNPIVGLWKNIGLEINKIGCQVGGEFDKISCRVSKIFNHGSIKCDDGKYFQTEGGTKESHSGLCGELLEKYIDKKMTMDARKQIAFYLHVAEPLLKDLAGLFAELNMDDPTKV